ncbi:hypothetical protein HPB50_026880 [Hyalomma asiaticum]|uniref:Uncharacterized protein n=1 Tax=Hyalomma asiaticum TaxID=266040 RepID=A0ACB7TRU0_HYAAI|nr:hypothetical protein HPB50_026880 [Hyalomma asiaticum]
MVNRPTGQRIKESDRLIRGTWEATQSSYLSMEGCRQRVLQDVHRVLPISHKTGRPHERGPPCMFWIGWHPRSILYIKAARLASRKLAVFSFQVGFWLDRSKLLQWAWATCVGPSNVNCGCHDAQVGNNESSLIPGQREHVTAELLYRKWKSNRCKLILVRVATGITQTT